jgi:ubiquitin C-terminal hydrolase
MLATRPMKNIGNSCYINSVLQMLAAMPGFQTHLCMMQEKRTDRHSDSTQSPSLLSGLCTLLTSVLNTPTAESLESVDITDLCSHFQAPFSAKEQQDAEEFLDYILNYLETACGYKPFTAWHILQGGVTNSIQCDICAHITSKVDPFTVLKIKFKTSSCKTIVQIKELLAYNFASERLVNENQFECLHADNRNETQQKLHCFLRRAQIACKHVTLPFCYYHLRDSS